MLWWAQWNYGDKSLAPWPDYPVARQRNLKNFAETISAFNKAVADLELAGFEVDRERALEEFELLEFVKPGKRPVLVAPAAPANDNSGGQPAPAPASAPAPGSESKPGPATPEQT